MTLIVGLVHEGRAHLAADSLSGDDRGIVTVAAEPKLFRVVGPAHKGPARLPELLFGFTTSWRFGQVAERALREAAWRAPLYDEAMGKELSVGTLPWPPGRAFGPARADDSGYARLWMVGWLVPTLREALRAAGWTQVKDNKETGGDALAAIRGRLFRITEDFAALESAEGYDAVGSGRELALGAFAATDGLPLTVERRLVIVQQVAERHNAWIRGPWRTEVAEP